MNKKIADILKIYCPGFSHYGWWTIWIIILWHLMVKGLSKPWESFLQQITMRKELQHHSQCQQCRGRNTRRLQMSLSTKVGASCMYLPNPSARVGCDTRSIFKQSLEGSHSEFSFSLTGYLTKAKERSLPYYLIKAGFITLPTVLVLC